MPLLNIFADNLLPVLLLAGAGFALGKILKVEPRPLGRVVFYILSPILVFDLITRSQLPPGRIALMMGFAASIMLATAGLALLIGRLLRLERTVLSAVILTTLTANNGNYGLPVIAFAFGQEALAYASIYFVTSNLMLYSLGVFTASLGHLRLKDALLGLLKVPAIYAIILAMVFVRTAGSSRTRSSALSAWQPGPPSRVCSSSWDWNSSAPSGAGICGRWASRCSCAW
jgi:predicted permease